MVSNIYDRITFILNYHMQPLNKGLPFLNNEKPHKNFGQLRVSRSDHKTNFKSNSNKLS